MNRRTFFKTIGIKSAFIFTGLEILFFLSTKLHHNKFQYKIYNKLKNFPRLNDKEIITFKNKDIPKYRPFTSKDTYGTFKKHE